MTNLTPTEIEIIRLVAAGNGAAEISRVTKYRYHSVGSLKKRLYKKIGVRTAPEMIVWAFNNKILEIASQI
jgi:DNA-binding CsgD family transcriptional regulator